MNKYITLNVKPMCYTGYCFCFLSNCLEMSLYVFRLLVEFNILIINLRGPVKNVFSYSAQNQVSNQTNVSYSMPKNLVPK